MFIRLKALSERKRGCQNSHKLKSPLLQIELYPQSWTQNFRSVVQIVVARVILLKGKFLHIPFSIVLFR